jgi:SAM-dependent methyltransferase
MISPPDFTMTRFLSSKKSVDDRALNRGVVDKLRSELKSKTWRPKIVEIGAGLGTMVARLLEWEVLRLGDYTILDVDPELIENSGSWLKEWAGRSGFAFHDCEGQDFCRITGPAGTNVKISFRCQELGDYLAQEESPQADLLIANAFLDLVDVPNMLKPLFQLLNPNGLFWFSVNFDGETILTPELPEDRAFMEVYHKSMDDRVRYGRPAGSSKTGRQLFGHLASHGAELHAAGSSDWVVFPQNRKYSGDEAYFLHHIINTIEQELAGKDEVDGQKLIDWAQCRHQHVEQGELVYIAHQLDVLGSRPK